MKLKTSSVESQNSRSKSRPLEQLAGRAIDMDVADDVDDRTLSSTKRIRRRDVDMKLNFEEDQAARTRCVLQMAKNKKHQVLRFKIKPPKPRPRKQNDDK